MKVDTAKEFFAETKQWIAKSIAARESGTADETQDVLNELESLPSATPPEEKLKVYQRVVNALKKKLADEAKAKV